MHSEIRQLNLKIGEAEKAKDKPFFENILSEDLLFTRASGKVNTKKQFLEGLDNVNLIYHEIKTDVTNISLSDNSMLALVHAVVYAKITNEGKNIEGNFMNIRLFQKYNTGWKLINWYNYELDKYQRQYKTTELETICPVTFPFPLKEETKTTLWNLYGHVCGSWEKLVDIRFKLLGFVPGVSILLILELSKQTNQVIVLCASFVGLLVTAAIWLYEIRNSELHDDLISRARKIESELGIENGQFLGRKKNQLFFIKHDIALNIIYCTTIVAWLFYIVYQLRFT